MNRYGQSITWSTVSAPHPFTGICTSYSYRSHLQRQLDEDESGDNRALIQHSKKADISFQAKVTGDSDTAADFLDLHTGAAITITGVNSGDSSGVILVTRAVERWSLAQPKTASIQAAHYPEMSGSGATSAGHLNAFTPNQGGLPGGLITPGGSLIYGTFPMTMPGTPAVGIVHMLEITQQLQITEDAPSPDGKILGATAHGYLRTISLELLSTAAAPAVGAALAINNAPDHAADYRIESVDTRFAEKRGKMYAIQAVWIPPLSA